MQGSSEFHYRLPASFGGYRPGAHKGTSLGAGQGFAAHKRLFDHPDPRRLDLRASVRDVRQEWLVRIQRQRVAVPVHAVVDVSASMHFGAARSKLKVAADFVEALGTSAFRAGDACGLLAFDHAERDDLFMPARHSRGAGFVMGQLLRDCTADDDAASNPQKAGNRGGIDGLRQAVARLAGRKGLVFLVSDFHWPLAGLDAVLELLAPACVVPMVAWDPAETEPPDAQALVAVSDAETGVRRSLWMRESLRGEWRAGVAARRDELRMLFEGRGLEPFYLHGAFDGEGLTRHFLEAVA
ncbi:MxaS protein [Methylibium sp.]|uniref:DUF58 domain-containing protein n=1 Tax=Methylibium sp. TaxID=2067992 RepID=UPI00184FC7EE|nr:MxaS protein [Methylibium sp.]MBA3589866.1 MxaS protein [Methylibium sp.]